MKIACIAVFALAATPACASEAWNVVEGPQGAQKGAWNVVRSGATVTGQAKMAGAHGDPASYDVVGRVEKGVYTLIRQNASDRRECVYRGVDKGDGSIVGSVACGAENGPWIARAATK